jgi:hypothetical protein
VEFHLSVPSASGRSVGIVYAEAVTLSIDVSDREIVKKTPCCAYTSSRTLSCALVTAIFIRLGSPRTSASASLSA